MPRTIQRTTSLSGGVLFFGRSKELTAPCRLVASHDPTISSFMRVLATTSIAHAMPIALSMAHAHRVAAWLL